MDKMRSRDEQDKSKSPKKVTMNQKQFENFYISRYTPKLSIDFDKILDRDKRDRNNSPRAYPLENKLNNPEKTKEKLQYNNNSFKCLLDYQKMQKEKAQKIKDEPVPVEMERIDRAYEFSSFKSNGINSFYSSVGKDSPCSLDMKLKKPTQFYFPSQV